jgi:hypothetical protein
MRDRTGSSRREQTQRRRFSDYLRRARRTRQRHGTSPSQIQGNCRLWQIRRPLSCTRRDVIRGGVHAYPMTRHRIDASSAAVGIPAAAYLIVLGLSALWFHSHLQPKYFPNPGLAAFKPWPATVIGDEMPARLLAQHGQVPPIAEIENPPEEPRLAVVESKPERIIHVKEPKRPQAPTPRWERGNPLRDYAAAYPGYSGNRPF